MIEKAMAIVSSCISRFSSTSGTSSPSTRMTGCDPTLMWRSDARRSAAIFSRSLICTGHLEIREALFYVILSRGDGEGSPSANHEILRFAQDDEEMTTKRRDDLV